MPIDHLPERAKPAARRFRDWFATDNGGLMVITAVMFMCRALSYKSDPPGVLQHVVEFTPLWVAPTVWALGALLLGVATHWRFQFLTGYALAYSASVLLLWGVLYIWSDPPALFGRGSVYISYALLMIYTVWRGESKTIRLEA